MKWTRSAFPKLRNRDLVRLFRKRKSGSGPYISINLYIFSKYFTSPPKSVKLKVYLETPQLNRYLLRDRVEIQLYDPAPTCCKVRWSS
jgi:hypothetical protein